jgi:tellurite resistance protein TerC
MSIGITGWVLFNLFVLLMLALDLGVFHRKAHAIAPREALAWSIVWVSLALAFNVWIYLEGGRDIALEFLTGYLLEKSLSVDNIFVIVMIFAFFRVPAALQHRVLFWGVMGALILRGTFIGLGAYVLHRWHWVFYVFGALLVITGIKMAIKDDEDADLAHNPVVRVARRLLPITHDYRGNAFMVREGGRWIGTPLLLVVLLVEVSDVLFAIDSIPAIFAITDDTFIVYTSNVFAILGLRSMFFLLAAVVDRFVYLKYGLALVLVFIGIKMLIVDFYKIPTGISLLVLSVLIGGAVAASLIFPPRRLQPPMGTAPVHGPPPDAESSTPAGLPPEADEPGIQGAARTRADGSGAAA